MREAPAQPPAQCYRVKCAAVNKKIHRGRGGRGPSRLSGCRGITPGECGGERPRPALRMGAPGQLVHLDIKKLGASARIGHRITGRPAGPDAGHRREFVHVCIDDCSRVAYAEVLPDEQGVTVAGFLRAPSPGSPDAASSRSASSRDNGSAYRSRLLAALCRARARPALYAPLHAAHQRQGRALHPDPAARVGLRRRVRLLGAPDRALTAGCTTTIGIDAHSALNGQPPSAESSVQDDLLRLTASPASPPGIRGSAAPRAGPG